MYFDNKDSFLQPKVSQYGSHMVMTNVSKPVKTKYWNIDTRFRDDYDNYSQTSGGLPIPWYTFTLPQSINDVKSIKVDNVELPMSFYNISGALGNNSMKITLASGTSYLIVVPDGIYTTTSTLKTAIASVISGISGLAFDVSNNANPFASFKNMSGAAISISFAIKPSSTNNCTKIVSAGATADFDKFNVKSKLGWLLGFRNISYTIGNNNTLLSESFIDLNSPRYVYLVLDEFSNGNQNSFVSPLPMSIINKNILAKISLDPVHYGFGTILTANTFNGLLKSDSRSYNGKVNLQKLKIQLINEYGHSIQLNGLDFSFCIEIIYE